MSAPRKDGGAAFPTIPPVGSQVAGSGYPYPEEGMTLLDWFAGQELSKIERCDVGDIVSAYDRVAKHCYTMAQAMIAEKHRRG